jgi:hypothetical protein
VIRLTFFPVFRLYSKKVHRPLGCEKEAVEMKSLELRKLELMSKIHELQMELDRLEWCEYMELQTQTAGCSNTPLDLDSFDSSPEK